MQSKSKKISLAVILVVFVLASGCANPKHKVLNRAIEINRGMKTSEVTNLLGIPQNRQFMDKNEAWQYCATALWRESDKFLIVWFYDDSVVGTNTYFKFRNTPGSCVSRFNTINWEDAPTKAVFEIRNTTKKEDIKER